MLAGHRGLFHCGAGQIQACTVQTLRSPATRIQPPRQHAARVERSELDAALLRAIGGHRVVLLQAPAGFGKTSLLAGLVAHGATQRALGAASGGMAVAWATLDQDDDAERARDAQQLFLNGGAGEVLRLVQQFPAAERSARLRRLAGSASTSAGTGLIVQRNAALARFLASGKHGRAQRLNAGSGPGIAAPARAEASRRTHAACSLRRCGRRP